jgi:hypothetical protein
VSGIGALVAGLGTLTYLDITTGSNPISEWIDGDEAPSGSEPDASYTKPAENSRYIALPAHAEGCSDGMYLSECLFSYELANWHRETGLGYFPEGSEMAVCSEDGAHAVGWVCRSACNEADFGSWQPAHSYFFLQEEVEGEWWTGDFQAATSAQASADSQDVAAAEGCKWTTGNAWEPSIAGYPPLGLVIHDRAELLEGAWGEFDEECVAGESLVRVKSYDSPVVLVRRPSQMHLSFPKAGLHESGTYVNVGGDLITGAEGVTKAITGTAEALKDDPNEDGIGLIDGGEHAKIGSKLAVIPGTAEVPSCFGATATECKTKLAVAGFTATPEVEELTWKTADLDVEPEHVVNTTPGEGDYAEESQTIKITINPKPTVANELAEKLITKNEKAFEANEEEDEAAQILKARRIARQCIQDLMLDEQTQATAISECETLPIFISGDEVPTATQHDIEALDGYPAWIKLNYESSAAKEGKVSRTWYTGLGGCSGTKPAESSCDEYPFYATQQGGPEDSPEPSLKWVNEEDNSKQGSKYSGFVSACGMAARSATDYAFLASPARPPLEIPTTRLCN